MKPLIKIQARRLLAACTLATTAAASAATAAVMSARPCTPANAPRRPNVMQQVLARTATFLLAMLLAIALAGCGRSGEPAREALAGGLHA